MNIRNTSYNQYSAHTAATSTAALSGNTVDRDGFKVTLCEDVLGIRTKQDWADEIMSVWVKFLNQIPNKSWNFGLKQYNKVYNEWVDDCRVGM